MTTALGELNSASPTFAIAVTPGGDRIITAGRSPRRGLEEEPAGWVRIWDATTLDLLADLPDQPSPVYAVSVSAAGDRIIAAGRGRGLESGWARVWDAASLELIADLSD